jgi:hypothetical protein
MNTRKKKLREEKKERGNDALDISHYTNYTQPTVKGLDKERSLKMPGGAKESHYKTWQDDQGPGRVGALLTIVLSGQTLTESQTKKRENVQTTQAKRDVERITETKWTMY